MIASRRCRRRLKCIDILTEQGIDYRTFYRTSLKDPKDTYIWKYVAIRLLERAKRQTDE